MDIKEKAKLYAIEAHAGQVRKANPRKPMIIHPINVANILESYGFDDNVIAAGYLHDVVEDTNHTMEDIEKEFGKDIASLVTGDNEPDKNWSWEERKKYTIETIKNLDLRHKAIVCADKISNLEDSKIDFGIKGKIDFSSFKRGFEAQKWYFTSIYQSLIYNEDENHPMFKKLKEIINYVFYNEKEKNYIENEVLETDFEKIKILHYKLEEILKLKTFVETKPFVIEFIGKPQNGKKLLMDNINNYFNKVGLKIEVINENNQNKQKDISIQIKEAITKKPDLVLIDRTIVEKLINLEKLFKKNKITFEEYNRYKKYQFSIIKKEINLTVILSNEEIILFKRNIKIDENNKNNMISFNNKKNISDEIIEYIIDNVKDCYIDKVNDIKELIKKK